MSPEEYCKTLQGCLGISNVMIKVLKPPAYIANLKMSNQQDSVILVYKEEKKNDDTRLYYTKTGEESEILDSVADLSLTGQPLECPFEDDKDDLLNFTVAAEPVVVSEDYYHAPLSMVEARRCLTIVSLKMVPPLPVWVLSDMSDWTKTFLLSCEIEAGWRARSWAVVDSNHTLKPPIDSMLDHFEETFRIASGYKVSSAVCCVFNLKDEPGMAKKSKCLLEVSWTKPSYEVPLSQADTSLILECKVGQNESQISRWWQQLNLLHQYLEIIKQQKQTQQLQVTYQRDSIVLPSFKTEDCESSGEPLKSRVVRLLQSSDSMSVCRQLASQHNVTSALNSTIHELLTDKQKGQDFTDRLWSLLIEAETYQELAECFQLVIREVRRQSVKPYIFAKNRTRLASLLRNIRTNSSDVELMLEPLELMVEIGLEKLKRDYMFMFLASQIATMESLSLPKLPSFGEMGSEWLPTVDGWLRWLAQLHTVLELVSVIHLAMSTPVLVQVTALALATYVSPRSPIVSLLHLIDNRTYELQAPVPTKEIKNFIEGYKTFQKWMLRMSAVADRHRITSTYVLLEESPLPQKILTLLVDEESLNNTENFEETLQEGISIISSKISEKFTYIKLCSIAEKLPY